MFKFLSAAALCAQTLVSPAGQLKIKIEPQALLGNWISSCDKTSCVARQTGSAKDDGETVIRLLYLVEGSPRVFLQMPPLTKADPSIAMTLDGSEWMTLKPVYCIAEGCFALTPALSNADLARLKISQTLAIHIRPAAASEDRTVEFALDGFDRVVDKVK